MRLSLLSFLLFFTNTTDNTGSCQGARDNIAGVDIWDKIVSPASERPPLNAILNPLLLRVVYFIFFSS